MLKYGSLVIKGTAGGKKIADGAGVLVWLLAGHPSTVKHAAAKPAINTHRFIIIDLLIFARTKLISY
jgi:hypothetical protein